MSRQSAFANFWGYSSVLLFLFTASPAVGASLIESDSVTNEATRTDSPPNRLSLLSGQEISSDQLYTQNHTSGERQGARKEDPPSGLGGAWERFLDQFSLGAKPDSDGASVSEWFGQRAQILRFNVTGVFTSSKFQGESDPLDGGSVSGVFAPALRLAEDTAIGVVYSGSYNRELQVFTEDEGPRQQQEEQRHEFIVLLSQDYLNPFGSEYIDRLTISPSFFQTYVFTRQSGDEEWGNGLPWRGVDKFDGLYDYWDRGGGLEVKAVHRGEERSQDSLSMAFQVYRRHYRNFISLARILNPASPQPKFEKDYIGYLGRAVYEHQTPGGPKVYLAYTYLQKNFTEDRADKDPILVPGVPGERRKDREHSVDARATIPVSQIPGLSVGLNGNAVYNMSNSGFNDALSPLPITGVFTSEYRF